MPGYDRSILKSGFDKDRMRPRSKRKQAQNEKYSEWNAEVSYVPSRQSRQIPLLVINGVMTNRFHPRRKRHRAFFSSHLISLVSLQV